MSFENPGDGIRCDHCNRRGQSYDYRGEAFSGLHANEGEHLCPGCLEASVKADYKQHGFRVVEDGRETAYRAGYITPRAWNYR